MLRDWHMENLISEMERSVQVEAQLQRLPQPASLVEATPILQRLRGWCAKSLISDEAYSATKGRILTSVMPHGSSSSSSSSVQRSMHFDVEQHDHEEEASTGGLDRHDSGDADEEILGEGPQLREDRTSARSVASGRAKIELTQSRKVMRTGVRSKQSTLAFHFGIPMKTQFERIACAGRP